LARLRQLLHSWSRKGIFDQQSNCLKNQQRNVKVYSDIDVVDRNSIAEPMVQSGDG